MNQRQGTQSTLTRTEVSGGGKKPWRQKGTGRARQGSTRAPQWTHGGVALGPKPRDYRLALNKKTKRVALFSALSAKVAAGELIVVDEIKLDTYKTAEMVKMLAALGCKKEVTKNYKVTTVQDGEVIKERKTRTATVAEKALIVLPAAEGFVVKSCANIPGVETTLYSTINVYEVLKAEKVVMTKAAIEKLEEVYA
jgi:large subunit ribosomal protein L4